MKHIIAIIVFVVLTSCSTLNHQAVSLRSERYLDPKKVIFTADDFGISKNINDGIVKGVENGLINHVDAMVTFENSINDIVALQRKFPGLEIGLHLSITSGYPVSSIEKVESLVNESGEFYSIDQLIPKLEKIDLEELETELRSQITTMLDHNIEITSISNQHNILSTYTPFFNVILKLALEYNVPLRSTVPVSIAFKKFDYAKTKIRGKNLAIEAIKGNPFLAAKYRKYFRIDEMYNNQYRMDNLNIQHPDYLIDVFWGEPTPENLFYILTNLPEGVSEIVFHLGLFEGEEEMQPGIDMDYYLMREFELMIITSPQIERWIDKLNIQIIGFKDL